MAPILVNTEHVSMTSFIDALSQLANAPTSNTAPNELNTNFTYSNIVCPSTDTGEWIVWTAFSVVSLGLLALAWFCHTIISWQESQLDFVKCKIMEALRREGVDTSAIIDDYSDNHKRLQAPQWVDVYLDFTEGKFHQEAANRESCEMGEHDEKAAEELGETCFVNVEV